MFSDAKLKQRRIVGLVMNDEFAATFNKTVVAWII
jgi:hypothetical protein